MPTSSGWSVLIGGAAFAAAGRLLGSVEFLVVGISGIAAVLLAVTLRLLRPSRVSVRRRLAPHRVAAGQSARVELEIVNRSRLRSPLMMLRDAVGDAAGEAKAVQLSLAPLRGSERCRGVYRLPTERRGVIELGPLRLDDVDALGLARRRHRIDVRARLLVHPPIERLGSARMSAGSDPLLGPELGQSLDMGDEEFEGLREYVPGDDLRRIHWRTSARIDDLQVRQFQPPRHGRLTVVIDTRPPSDQRRSVDATASIAASIAVAALAAGDTVSVEASDGRRTAAVSGTRHIDTILEFLALLSGGDEQIHPSVPDASGTVIVASADPLAAHDGGARQRLAQRLRADLTITVDAARWSAADGAPVSTADWIHLSGPGQLAGCWGRRRANPSGSLRVHEAAASSAAGPAP